MRTKLFYLLSLIVAMMVFAKCAVDPESLATTVEAPAVIDPEVIAAIEGMGFKTDGIYETDNAFWVEGDIVIPKEYFEKSKTRQYSYGNDHIVDRNIVDKIKIAVDFEPSNPDGYPISMGVCYSVINEVVEEFNNITDCILNIQFVSTANPHHILITANPWHGIYFNNNSRVHNEMVCTGLIPWDGNPGSIIAINNDAQDGLWSWNRIPKAKVKTSLIHAIGHCLGLAHTNGLISGDLELEEDDDDIEPLSPGYDPASVMNASEHNYNNQGGGLSDDDKLALAKLYPTFSGGSIVPRSQTVTSGSTPTALTNETLPVGASGTIAYKWERKTPGGSSWAEVSGTGVDYTFPSPLTTEGTYTYRRKATAGGQSVYSNEAVIIVTTPALTPGTISGDQTILSGLAPAKLTGTLPTGGTGSYTYQWQMREDGSAWTNVQSSGTSRDYQPPVLTASTDYRRVVTSGDQTAESNTVAVSVISITGPDNPRINPSGSSSGPPAVYNVPTTLPSGIVFNGWTVVPNTYSTIIGLSYPVLPIHFTSVGQYIVTANFSQANGSDHSISRTVNAVPPLIPGSLRIYSDETSFPYGQNVLVGFTKYPTGGTGTYTHNWERRASYGSWSPLPGVISSYGTKLYETTLFRCKVTSGDQSYYTNEVTVTILPQQPLRGGSIAYSYYPPSYGNSHKAGTVPNPITSVSGAVGGPSPYYTYTWQQHIITGSAPPDTWIVVGSGPTFQPPVLWETTSYRRMAHSDNETAFSNIVTINVAP